MSSYHSSFFYNGENSATDRDLIVATFEPDDGLKETFLSMDVVQEDYYDGSKKYTYGSRYNTTANIIITVIKNNGSDFSLNEVRSHLKWLTGARVDSWLEFYIGDVFQYAFLGRVTDVQQQKMDARTIGLSITFTSVTPWAYSDEQIFDRSIAQALLLGDGGVLIKDPSNEISLGGDGVLCNSGIPSDGACFCVTDDGILYVEDIIVGSIDNETDDLYSYLYLDIEFTNQSCEYLEIRNETLNEITRVDNLKSGDIIHISNKQFIVAYRLDELSGELKNQNRIFGDDFNFIWPRLMPGENYFVIDGNGNGHTRFAYRYPMKVGDCAMDVNMSGNNINCGAYPDDNNEVFTGTIAWSKITNTPSTLKGYGIKDAYTIDEVDEKIDDIEVSGGSGTNTNIDEEELNNMLEDILGT